MGRLLVAIFVLALSANAQEAPICRDHGRELPENNAQVVKWKNSTKNQFRARGHITGKLVKRYHNASGHHHFSVQIGDAKKDTIEVIYNDEFGALPDLYVGMAIEACGDYITSNRQAGRYPPSPDGAIIHWVHKNPNGDRHDDGYLVLDDHLAGQENP